MTTNCRGSAELSRSRGAPRLLAGACLPVCCRLVLPTCVADLCCRRWCESRLRARDAPWRKCWQSGCECAFGRRRRHLPRRGYTVAIQDVVAGPVLSEHVEFLTRRSLYVVVLAPTRGGGNASRQPGTRTPTTTAGKSRAYGAARRHRGGSAGGVPPLSLDSGLSRAHRRRRHLR